MVRAIDNERLAVQKTLEDAYRRELLDAATQFERLWAARLDDVKEAIAHEPAAAGFARAVRSFGIDGLILYDKQGRAVYPTTLLTLEEIPKTIEIVSAYEDARRLEREGDGRAVEAYAAVALKAKDATIAARALQGKIRCLIRTGKSTEALDIILRDFGEKKYQAAVDEQSRLIVPNAELLGLTLVGDANRAEFMTLATRLQRRLEDYGDGVLPSSQRRFLMRELERLVPGQPYLPLLHAEELAVAILETHFAPRVETNIQSTPQPDVFAFRIGNGEAVALVKSETLCRSFEQLIDKSALIRDGKARLLSPRQAEGDNDARLALPLGRLFAGWQCAVNREDVELGDVAAQRRIVGYLWAAMLAIVVICASTVLIAVAIRHQMRLARLKSDLVATVSHELRTPLTSIRLLVETLLNADAPDSRQTREYLQLIAKENLRLSRLIDNFLAFSRMERNRNVFQKIEVDPAAIVRQAVDAVRERFERPGFRLDVESVPDMPAIVADPDALTTVLVNLVDNAIKYTGEEKIVSLRAYTESESVCFSVGDNGIGIARAALKKIFTRYYQVDRRLSRETGGCGLGLSIVEYIVSAHGGSIHVESQPGRGSVFTVRIPKCSHEPKPSL